MATAVKFRECNVTFAEDQPEYTPLPAFRDDTGMTITCWQLSPDEVEEVKRTGQVYLSQLTFNQPLQPVKITARIEDLIELY